MHTLSLIQLKQPIHHVKDRIRSSRVADYWLYWALHNRFFFGKKCFSCTFWFEQQSASLGSQTAYFNILISILNIFKRKTYSISGGSYTYIRSKTSHCYLKLPNWFRYKSILWYQRKCDPTYIPNVTLGF